jgi:hypothetical protein
MIRHQVKIQDDPMLNALATGKRWAKRSLFVHSFSQSLALVDRANPRAVGCLINQHS